MQNVDVMDRPYELTVNQFFASVYKWMTLAMAVSTLVAWRVSQSAAFVELLASSSGLFMGLVIFQLIAVVALAAFAHRMSFMTTVLVFLGYAALTGLTISTIFLVYTVASIAQVFVVTAATFGALSVYGYTTKRDLTAWRSFLFMSLIGLIIASVVNFFMNSHFLTWVTTYAGIIIFAGLTAYDTQKLKAMSQVNVGGETMQKLAIQGALILYLDFINLFLHLLRAIGDQR